MKLTLATNFLFSKDTNEMRVTHSKSHNTKMIINDKAGEVIKDLMKPLSSRNQIG